MSAKAYCPISQLSRPGMTNRQKMTLWAVVLLSVTLLASGLAIATVNSELFFSFLPAAWADDSDQDPAADQDGRANTEENSVDSGKLESDSQAQTFLPVKAFRLDNIQPTVQTQTFSGIVMARRSSRLAAEHLGRITRIHVDLGDAVQAGQVLAELDQRELLAEKSVLEAQLSGAQARLEELQQGPRIQEIQQAEALVRQFEATLTLRQANLTRTEDLVKSASISKQEYDEALTGLEATRAQLESAQKTLDLLREGTRKEQVRSQEAVVKGLESQLEKIQVLISELVITAPFDGHVQARLVDEGVIVSPGQPIVEVVETGSLEVHVGVPAQLVNSGVLDNAKVLCGKEDLSAELVRISPSIDHRTRNLEAVFEILSECHVLPASNSNKSSSYSRSSAECRIGQAVDIQVSVRSDGGGWWIPTSALVAASRGLWSVLVVKTIEDDGDLDEKSDSAVLQTESAGLTQDIGKSSVIQTVQVELLRASGDWSQIRGALKGSDQLVLSGTHRITSGQRVRAVVATPQEAGSLDSVAPGLQP